MTTRSGNISDPDMEWKLARVELDIAKAGFALTEGTPNLVTGLAAGTPTLAAEVLATTHIKGIPLDTSDEIYWYLDVKSALWEMDLLQDFQLGLSLYHTGGADTGVDFTATIKGFAAGAAITDAKVAPDGSITFPAAALTAASFNEIGRKNFGLTSGVFGQHSEHAAADVGVVVTLTLADRGTASANEIHLMAATLYGTRNSCSHALVRQET